MHEGGALKLPLGEVRVMKCFLNLAQKYDIEALFQFHEITFQLVSLI